MPRPTRTYPGFLKSAIGPQALALVDCMGGVLRGHYDCAPLFMTADKTHVFLVGSGSRHGVLLEAFEKPGEDPGVWVSEVVFLYDSYSPATVLYAEVTSHRVGSLARGGTNRRPISCRWASAQTKQG